jgi:hypothetical protein
MRHLAKMYAAKKPRGHMDPSPHGEHALGSACSTVSSRLGVVLSAVRGGQRRSCGRGLRDREARAPADASHRLDAAFSIQGFSVVPPNRAGWWFMPAAPSDLGPIHLVVMFAHEVRRADSAGFHHASAELQISDVGWRKFAGADDFLQFEKGTNSGQAHYDERPRRGERCRAEWPRRTSRWSRPCGRQHLPPVRSWALSEARRLTAEP